MENGPANRIRREKSATVSGLNLRASNERAHELNLIQQFPACPAYKAITANFAKNHTAIRALELSKNRFKKIRHEESASRRERGQRRIVALRELNQIVTQRRQIVFPGKNAGAQRELRIGALHGIFEEPSHARHHLEIANCRPSDGVTHGIRFRYKLFHHFQKLGFELGIVDGQNEMREAALVHESAY